MARHAMAVYGCMYAYSGDATHLEKAAGEEQPREARPPPPPEGCVVGTSVRARLNWLPRTFVRRARRGRCEVCRALRPTSVLWERADGGGGCL